MPPHPLFYGTFQYIHPFHYHLHENSPLVMAQNQSTSRRIPHPIDQRLVIEETKVSTLLLFCIFVFVYQESCFCIQPGNQKAAGETAPSPQRNTEIEHFGPKCFGCG